LLDISLIMMVVVWLVTTLLVTRWSAPWVFGSALLACLLMGLVDINIVLAKATNEGLVTLVLLMLISVGFERLPWLLMVSRRMVVPSLTGSLLRVSLVTAVFSAFVNNTAVVATLAGVLRRSRLHAPSQLLLPLSYAAILGGTLTLIGTSTNLIVSSFLQEASGKGIDFFAFLPVALPAAIAGIICMALFRHRLPQYEQTALQISEHLIEAKVLPESKLIGRSIVDNGLRDLDGLFLVEIARGHEILSPVAPSQCIESGDRLIFSGDVSRVGLLSTFQGLQLFAIEEGLLSDNMTEVILLPNAAVAGQTIKESSFRARFDAAVVGLRRDGAQLSGKLGGITLQPGDYLALAVGPDFSQRMNLGRNFLVVNSQLNTMRLPLLVSIFITAAVVAVVTLAAMGILALIKGLAFLLAIFLVLGVIKGADLRRRFPFEMWIIIASALTVAQGLQDTGAVAAAAAWAAPLITGIEPLWILIMVYLLTVLLTELMTNNAAAALMFPVAWTLALSSGVDPMPFAMAIAFGASASFLTPYGYTTNLMVQNLGSYKRKDYWRYGLPITLIYSTVVLLMLPRAFPL
jgi:di/tricarboxylate transporter